MKNKKLKLVLNANAAFSALSGLTMVSFHNSLAERMGIAVPLVLLLIGLGLIGFALFLIWTARQHLISYKLVNIFIWLDWIWVLSSLLIILMQAFGLNLTGYIVMGVVALIVADFAVLQRRFIQHA